MCRYCLFFANTLLCDIRHELFLKIVRSDFHLVLEDILVTREIVRVDKLLDVGCLAHLVIGQGKMSKYAGKEAWLALSCSRWCNKLL